MAKKKNFLNWAGDDNLIEVIRLLSPYLTYADIGRLLNRNRRTIHYVASNYGLQDERNKKGQIPLVIIKSRDKFDKDLLSVKDILK